MQAMAIPALIAAYGETDETYIEVEELWKGSFTSLWMET